MIELPAILDLTVIFLLIVAIVYGVRLSRRISVIQRSRNELSTLFRAFDDTIVKAQVSIEHLKDASTHASNGLQKQIDKAAILVDDLEFMEEKSRAACDLLSDVVKAAAPVVARARDVVDSRAPSYEESAKPSPAAIKRMRNQRRAATSSEVMAPAIKENRASSSSIAPSKASGKGEASGVSSDMERRAQNLESAIHRIAAGRHHSSKDVNVVTSSKKTEDDIAKALKSLGYGS